MNDHHDADVLSTFVDARHRGGHPDKTNADTQFAATLLDMSTRVRATSGFVDALAAQLMSESATQPLRATTALPPSLNGRMAPRRQSTIMTWAAVLAVVVLLGAFGLLLGQPNAIRIQPAAMQDATAIPTPIPVFAANPLPILVGGYATDPAVFDRMWDAGMRWTGLSLEYRAADADAILDEARAYMDAARERGLGVLVSLYGSADEVSTAQTDDYAAIANFAAQVAALGPMAIEVWPEANLSRGWPESKIGGGSYTELLRPVSEAAKAVNPDIWIITGAPAPTGAEAAFPGQVVNDDTFYAQLVRSGGGVYADCIGVHYVEGILDPRATSGDPRQPNDSYSTGYLVPMLHRASMPFRTAAILHVASLPTCVTQLGYLSPEGVWDEAPQYFEWANGTTVEEQAAWLADSITTVATLSSVQVVLVMIWQVDHRPISQDHIGIGYAIIRPDDTCPACDAIAKLQH